MYARHVLMGGSCAAVMFLCLPVGADTVVPPNLIVAGRACVGSPCASGDSLGGQLVVRVADTSPGGTGTGPQVLLTKESSSGTALQTWKIFSSSSDALIFRADTDGNNPFSISDNAPSDALVVNPNGSVSVGSGANAASLHVRRTNGTAKLLVEEASATVAGRNMLQIKNSGASTFRFDNTATGQVWGFGALGSGNFFVGSTPGQPLGFVVTPDGNVSITGTLSQGSDRASKGGVEPVVPEDVLARLLTLPISTWHYKSQPGVKHMGPMAQDFAAAFGLGDDERRLGSVDVDGVNLAAIQALHGRIAAAQRELEGLRERLAVRERSFEALAERLATLEAAAGR